MINCTTVTDFGIRKVRLICNCLVLGVSMRIVGSVGSKPRAIDAHDRLT
jgi:hypothetical protein